MVYLSKFGFLKLTGPRGVHVGVEQWRHELDLGGSGGEVILENDLAFVQSSLPGSALLARNAVPENEGRLNIKNIHGGKN